MKKTIVLGLAMGLAAISVPAFAASDNNSYPASDFQPKVVYIDKDAVKKEAPKAAAPAGKAEAADSSAPACKPEKVAAAAPAAVEFDPKYPAANFQPKVIYP